MEDRGWRTEILAFVHLQSSILYPQSLCLRASVAKSGLLTSLSPVGPGFSNPQLLEFVLERLPVKPDRRRCLADVSGVTVQYVDQVLSFKRGPGLFVGQLGKFRSASARRTTRRNLGRQVPHVDGALGAKNDASLDPSRSNRLSSRTLRTLAWVPRTMSPISSRKSVPPSASSNLPCLRAMAPVKAPFS